MIRCTPTLETLKHEVRRRVCPHCYRRPPGSEAWGPDVIRPCAAGCPLFLELPALRRAAISTDPMVQSVDAMLRHRIADACAARPGTRGSADEPSSPLWRNRDRVVRLLVEAVGE